MVFPGSILEASPASERGNGRLNQSLAYEIDGVMAAAVDTGLFASLVTFKDRPGGDTPQVDDLGQVDLANEDYDDVDGLVDVVCMFSVLAPGRPDPSSGQRTSEYYVESGERHLLLNGFYPDVLARFIAVVDGSLYEITPGSVEHASQEQMTRLAVRAYNL